MHLLRCAQRQRGDPRVTDEREADTVDWIERMGMDPEKMYVEGDPDEALAANEARIDELEAALEDLDESDPQHGPVRFELASLKAFRQALREFPEQVTGQEDDS